MFFLRKKPQKLNNSAAKEAPLANVDNLQPASTENLQPSNPPETVPQLGTVNIFGKSFLKQRIQAGSEDSSENEVWAPELNYVGLFRKHRAKLEEQSSSQSGPQ